MRAERIKLRNFRNLRAVELDLCEQTNIIYGNNGQGKTNFIEAMWLFTGAKSFRGVKDRQLITFDEQNSEITLDFFGEGRSQQAQLCIETKRTAFLNEIALKTPGELAGHFCAVVFSPTHLSLIKDGPQQKRRFIDTSICQIKPKYIHILNQYNRALDQRNQLLKDVSYETSLLDTLDIWDMRLASFAAVIVKTRASFLERLTPFAQEIYAGISQQKEQLMLQYASSLRCDTHLSIAEMEQQILEHLRMMRSEDLRTRITGLGPHRDDIEVLLDGHSARSFASQGQQRSGVLSLKLAECELLREHTGEYPVVLLDDVMSELDASRRSYLLNHLNGRQMILTCCNRDDFVGLTKGVGIEIDAGQVISYDRYE